MAKGMLGSLYYMITADNSGFKRSINDTGNTLDRFKNKVSKWSGLIKGFLAGAFTVAVAKVVDLGMSAEETSSKFDAIFKDMAASTRQWAQEFSDRFGFAKAQMETWLSSIQDTLVPMGMVRSEAAEMSKDLVKLAADLGSFNNVDTADVLRDIQSALVGQSEPMRKYGVVITETRLKQFALTQGIIKQGEELTELQKLEARRLIMLNDTTDAQGDLARTMDSTANQFEKAKNQIVDIATSLGSLLLPGFNKVLTVANKFLKTVSGIVDKFKEQKSESKNLETSLFNLMTEYKNLTEKTSLTADEKERLKTVTKQLSELMPDVISGYDKENKRLILNNALLEENYIKRQQALVQAELELKKAELEKQMSQVNRAEKNILTNIGDTEEAQAEIEWLDQQIALYESLGRLTSKQEKELKSLREERGEWYKILEKSNKAQSEEVKNFVQTGKEIQTLESELAELTKRQNALNQVLEGKISLEQYYDTYVKKVEETVNATSENIQNAQGGVTAYTEEELKRAEYLAQYYRKMVDVWYEGIKNKRNKINSQEEQSFKMLQEQYKRYQKGKVSEREFLAQMEEEMRKKEEQKEQRSLEFLKEQYRLYNQGKVAQREEEIRLAEEQRKITEAQFVFEYQQGLQSSQKYLEFLQEKLKGVEMWSSDYISILLEIAEIEKQVAEESKNSWQQFLDGLLKDIKGHPVIELFRNMGFDKTKIGVGLNKMVDWIGEKFSKLFSSDWVGVLVAILSQLKSFRAIMELLNSFLGPVFALIDSILMPLLKIIGTLWNAILEGLEKIEIFGWKPFEGVTDYKVDFVDDQDEPEDEREQTNSGTQYTTFTGQALSHFETMFRPLIYLESIDRNIIDIRNALLAGAVMAGQTVATPTGQVFNLTGATLNFNMTGGRPREFMRDWAEFMQSEERGSGQ